MSIEYSSSVEHSIETVFTWHERPGAFQRLAPPWQAGRVVEEARSLANGRAVIRLPGGIRWVAQHRDYDAPHSFVDDLVSLPLPWHHVHSFAPAGPGPDAHHRHRHDPSSCFAPSEHVRLPAHATAR